MAEPTDVEFDLIVNGETRAVSVPVRTLFSMSSATDLN